MQLRIYTDDEDNERISGFGVIDALDIDGVDWTPEPGEQIGVVESTEARDGGLYATIRLTDKPEE